jgi:hypothetical protein
VEVPPGGRLVLVVPARARRRGVELLVRDARGAVRRERVPCFDDDAEVSGLEVRWGR